MGEIVHGERKELSPKLRESCPFLLDSEFTERYPGILEVALYWQTLLETAEYGETAQNYFKKLGLNGGGLVEYLEKLNAGDEGVTSSYRNIRNALFSNNY